MYFSDYCCDYGVGKELMEQIFKIPKNSLESKSLEHFLHPYTKPGLVRDTGPQIIKSGNGIYVFDNNGKSYIEGMSGLWCASLGFGEERLTKVVKEQMEILPFYHSFTGKTTEPPIVLAEKLAGISPDKLQKIFFCNSGSEANDTAIKISWYYHAALGNTKKRKVISRKGGYHGGTLAAGSLTALDYAQKGFSLPLDFAIHTASPHYFQNSIDGESEEDFSYRIASELERLIDEHGAETIGAFIAEPLMGAGGVILPPKGYFELVQPILKKNNILMIADEVICGFGRTGNMWGSDTFGISPDILTCAKGLSSGYIPISAVLISEAIAKVVENEADKLGQFGHGFTYSAHPVAAAVAIKTIEIMETDDILNHVRKISTVFRERINNLERFECVGDTRSIGLIGAAEFVKPGSKNTKLDVSYKFAANAVRLIQEKGVILRGLPIDAIAFCPPLIITEGQVNEMFDRIETVLPGLDQFAKSLS